MQKVRVELGERSYNIVIDSGILGDIGRSLEKFEFSRKIALISNPTVYRLYGDTVRNALVGSGFDPVEIIIPDGEEYKNLAQVRDIYGEMLKARLDRKSVVMALGGGVIGDIAGFAASTYMRGIDFVQVPTTLLAQVDSSVGGKTGVNHTAGKNMIGTFWQPRLVWVDISTLKTLPKRELLAGLAEVIKYGVIWDREFFEFLESRRESVLNLEGDALAHIIERSCEIKADVVSKDEREAGIRAILNYGHTIGHAIETVTGYTRYLHGEAVAMGMYAEAKAAQILGMVDDAAVKRIRTLIEMYGLPAVLPDSLDFRSLFESMQLDKKTVSGELKFILPESIGKVKVHKGITEAVVREALGSSSG